MVNKYNNQMRVNKDFESMYCLTWRLQTLNSYPRYSNSEIGHFEKPRLPFSCSEGDIDGDPVSCGVEKSLDCVVYSWVLVPTSCGLLFGSWRCCV